MTHYFEIKDSGEREEFASGMKRDTEDGKPDLTYLFELWLAERLAEHMTKGAVKYGRGNYLLAKNREELDRYMRSLLRHVRLLYLGDRSEDHAAAIIFNVDNYERVLAGLDKDARPAGRPDLLPATVDLSLEDVGIVSKVSDVLRDPATGMSPEEYHAALHAETVWDKYLVDAINAVPPLVDPADLEDFSGVGENPPLTKEDLGVSDE